MKVQGRTSGFTLVELLVVIAILGLVVGLAGPQVMRRLSGAKAQTADLQIEDFGAALDLFLLDTGRYPTTDEGLQSLLTAPLDVVNWSGPYLNKSDVPDDPWGRPYAYRAPGEHGVYDLYSYGSDGSPGGESDAADVVSWD
ncbi:MAG: type II secretion system major pseudopilin GspG [Rhodospirillaceae bacterium]|nr:type II secretion system major pseudopilin GspG [Rhodospirillaceae bacterium]